MNEKIDYSIPKPAELLPGTNPKTNPFQTNIELKKPGKKKKEEGLFRIAVRATSDEKRKIHQNSKRSGLSVSRFLVLSGLTERPVFSEEERQVQLQLVVQLRRIGTNINQIAAQFNSSKYINALPPEAAEIKRAAEMLQSLLKNIEKEMGL